MGLLIKKLLVRACYLKCHRSYPDLEDYSSQNEIISFIRVVLCFAISKAVLHYPSIHMLQ